MTNLARQIDSESVADTPSVQRRYTFKLYPTAEQADVLTTHCRMRAELWNALLQRYEDIQRRTQQRTVWFGTDGKRHAGISLHNPVWTTTRKKNGETVLMQPDDKGRPKPFTDYDMQNEVTWLCNAVPEWREPSIWCWHRTAKALYLAIKAFYSRASKGAGKSSGPPRFQKVERACRIGHRTASGCMLLKDTRHDRSWQVRLKGVPGAVHARGIFPPGTGEYADVDIAHHAGVWWFSICVEREIVRRHGSVPTTVRLDLLDQFALVNNEPRDPDGLASAMLLDEAIDRLKAERDTRWPRGKRVPEDEREDLADMKAEISRLSAKAARIRSNALHVWTARIVAGASELTITAPAVRQHTKTPRGNEKDWGAAVAPASAVNRHTLWQSPAAAVQMLKYKSEEARIRCDVMVDNAPAVAVGRDLVEASKTTRRARRMTKGIRS